MKILSRIDIMVQLKEKIFEAKQTRDNELVSRLEKLLDNVMSSNNPASI